MSDIKLEKYETFMTDESDCIFVKFPENEKYKNLVVKVGHIQFNEDFSVEFDLDFSDGNKAHEDDTYLTEQVQGVVGDIMEKAFKSVVADTNLEFMLDLEKRASEALSKYIFDLKGKSFLETFSEKGYIVTEDEDDRLVLSKVGGDEIYYFDKDSDLSLIRNILTGGVLIL